jgi:hypothetical protein
MAIDAGQSVRLRYIQPAGRASVRMALVRIQAKDSEPSPLPVDSPDVFVGMERAYLPGNGHDLITALRVAE